MGRPIDYVAALTKLETAFGLAEADFRDGVELSVPDEIVETTRTLFASSTRAFREALIGCVLARLSDPEIDIRLPYMKQDEAAFNGRTLDEKVVNPFLREHAVPCSSGPYLSALRRNIKLIPETATGLRDKDAFAAMLKFIEILSVANSDHAALYLRYLLGAFVRMRDEADVPLSRIARFSVEQYEVVIDGMLATPSGGLVPVFFVVAMLRTLSDCFQLGWQIEFQGINVADRATGVGGDVTVSRDGAIVLAIEITERRIERARVVSTFETKIAPHGLEDYLFFFSAAKPTDEAHERARAYFAAGHDINFVAVRGWLMTTMATIGPRCRALFTEHMLELLDEQSVPSTVKVAWNDAVTRTVG
jgi:hypothetical protein